MITGGSVGGCLWIKTGTDGRRSGKARMGERGYAVGQDILYGMLIEEV